MRKHWMCWTAPIRTYGNMKSRCDNPNTTFYKDYGWRWIWYPEDWKTFEWFWKDMWPTWKPWLTIERINNNKSYSKDNCKWIPQKEQAWNRRSTLYVEYKWKREPLAKLCDELCLNYKITWQRITRQWLSVDEALNMKPWENMETCNRKKVVQYTKKWQKIKIFNSITEAKKETWISSIGNCCKWRAKTAGGYKWKYY